MTYLITAAEAIRLSFGMAGVPVEGADSAAERLKAYVPLVAIDWLRETPEARYKQVEGSLAFVDISGFTSLTERLSRKGKVGAEEMNDLLNDCFEALLSTAYDYGAGVIKWGGDAVLLLFQGEQHEARACRAALEMQQTMASVGKLRTSSGLVTLRMSIGIHSGTFDFFLVGSLHRELVITGPAASMTVAMETVAEATEVAVSPSTAAALDPRWLGTSKGAGDPPPQSARGHRDRLCAGRRRQRPRPFAARAARHQRASAGRRWGGGAPSDDVGLHPLHGR